MTTLDDVANGRAERNLEPPEGKFPEPEECSECGNEFPDKHYHCFTHLESTEDLRDYAHEKVECLDRLIGENRELQKRHSIFVDGALEHTKNQYSQIAALKSTVKELQEVINKQIDHANRLLFNGLGEK